MQNFLRAMYGIVGIAAFAGRGMLFAYYGRGVAYATDVFIRVAGLGLIIPVGAILMNFWFMNEIWTGGQVALALILPLIGMFYLSCPSIIIPSAGALAAIAAGAPGDQPNIPITIDAVKQYYRMIGIVIVWLGVYVFMTIVGSVYLSPDHFWLGHVPIVILLAMLMAGKIEVSTRLYKTIERGAYLAIAVLYLLPLVFQEDVGKWARMAQTKQALAKLYAKAKNKKDAYNSDLLEKVHVNEKGEFVIIVDGKPRDGSGVVAGVAAAISNEGVLANLAGTTKGTEEAAKWCVDMGRTFEWSPNVSGAVCGAGVMTAAHVAIPLALVVLALFGITRWRRGGGETVSATRGLAAPRQRGVTWGQIILVTLILLAGWWAWEHFPADMFEKKGVPVAEANAVLAPHQWSATVASRNANPYWGNAPAWILTGTKMTVVGNGIDPHRVDVQLLSKTGDIIFTLFGVCPDYRCTPHWDTKDDGWSSPVLAEQAVRESPDHPLRSGRGPFRIIWDSPGSGRIVILARVPGQDYSQMLYEIKLARNRE